MSKFHFVSVTDMDRGTQHQNGSYKEHFNCSLDKTTGEVFMRVKHACLTNDVQCFDFPFHKKNPFPSVKIAEQAQVGQKRNC